VKVPLKVQCCFEEWDREKHEMGHCPAIATKKIGRNYLCDFHAEYVAFYRQTSSRDKVVPAPLEGK
jgi:hypothetical protein